MPIGKLEPFDLNSKQWPAYVRRVKQYILLNEIKVNLHVPLLITVVGEPTYSLMCDLCSPILPEAKEFEELVSLISDHLEPQRSEIAERHIFRLRRQKPSEPLIEYLQQLKHLATTCNFGTKLEENLRDQFVSGLASEAMRSRIFAEKNILYKEAVDLALALEAAEKHAEVSAVTAAATTSGTVTSYAEGLHQASGGRSRGGGGGGGSYGGRAQRGQWRGSAAGAGGPSAPDAAPSASSRCWRCGKPHRPDKCRFSNYNCDNCGRRGHLRVMCSEGRDSGRGRQHYVDQPDCSDEDVFNIELASKGNKPYFLRVAIEDHQVDCEVDTGSRISAISEYLYNKTFSNKCIISDDLMLRCYSGLRIESLGYILVKVRLGDVLANNLKLYIIKNGSCPLLGREWIRALNIKQIIINQLLTEDSSVSRLTAEFPQVFTDRLGEGKKLLQLQLTDSEPVYVRARPVPLALRSRVERELERLEKEGTIYRVDYSEYGTPIVPVIKANGDIRICGDYKVTINRKLKRDFYPLPRIEELFAVLSGGQEFSKIDLTNAYLQTKLSEDSQACTAITTHLGTFVYRRTPFGLSCIPEKFQKMMEETLRGVPNTVVFLDDICVTGSNREIHFNNLRLVLERLRDMGLTIKLNKCSFLKKSVKYLGFIIDQEGLHPDKEKVQAIFKAPRPSDVTQLKSFLGLLNYYGKFIPNLSILLHPLHELLKKGKSFNWSASCEKSFEEAKRALVSKHVLAHYEEGRPLILSVDSSAYGLGAVLAHRYPDGSERPVSCVSRTLNDAEKNYSQFDKEALAIFYGVTRHHQYLFGRRFELKTDHQPLSYIFGEKAGLPQTAASRLQRWATRLAAYEFTVKFVKSENNGPADALSRLPLSIERHPTEAFNYINLVRDSLPIDFNDVCKETKRDKILNKIIGFVKFGWPLKPSNENENPYFFRRNDLIVDFGCLIYKYRIVIPQSLRKRILEEIHMGHLGVNKMKNVARNYVYWPNIDNDIEQVCRTCDPCRSVRDSPPHAELHPWEIPIKPWQRIHADFADCAGNRYLIMIDAYSKWIEVILMARIDAETTISAFMTVFSRFGLPTQLVTDNGPPFFSTEFRNYCKNNCIRHTTTAPYRPQGNGAAENAVKTVKKSIKRAIQTGENITQALHEFLFCYRNCNHATTGISPAELLLGRRLRNRLDALRPSLAEVVRLTQKNQINKAGGNTKKFDVGDTVLARDYSVRGDKWMEGTICKKTGPVSYKVDVVNGLTWRRHQDQIIPLTDKSKFSLTRPSIVPSQVTSSDENCEEGEEQFEDASGGIDDKEGESKETEFEGSRACPSPPRPDASARALRAFNRALKKN
jgi:transposase InsO family protein